MVTEVVEWSRQRDANFAPRDPDLMVTGADPMDELVGFDDNTEQPFEEKVQRAVRHQRHNFDPQAVVC